MMVQSFIIPINTFGQEKIEDILFTPGYKYRVSFVHNFVTNEDYELDEAGFVGDARICVDEGYKSIRITQRLTTYLMGDGILEADNKNVETTYFIDAAYPAKDREGNYAISANCKTESGKNVLVEISLAGTDENGKVFYCYHFRDGIFDNLIWCFYPSNREKQ
jgi:hypothetical protein